MKGILFWEQIKSFASFQRMVEYDGFRNKSAELIALIMQHHVHISSFLFLFVHANVVFALVPFLF